MIIDAHAHIFSHVCRKAAPEQFRDGRFPIDRLVTLMDREGVDRAVLVQNPTIGIINDEVQAALEAHPGRFAGAIQVDPFTPDAAAVIRRYAAHPSHRAVKLEMSEEWGWSGIHPGIRLDSPELRSIWAGAENLRLVVIIDPGVIGQAGYQVEAIDALSGQYAGASFLIEHLGYLEKKNRRDPRACARRAKMLRLAAKPNVYLGFSATGILLDEDYPCPGAVELMQEAIELAGAGKILWGTDIPLTLKRYTYREMLDVVLQHTPFLSEPDRRRILGENAATLFFAAR